MDTNGKTNVDVEYIGTGRPPWVKNYPEDWDSSYDTRLGRNTKVNIRFVPVDDTAPKGQPDMPQCVAFATPKAFADKLLPQSCYRIYDKDRPWNPLEDIIGANPELNANGLLKQENAKLKNIIHDAQRRYLSLTSSLGKQGKAMPDEVVPGVKAILQEQEDLAPTKAKTLVEAIAQKEKPRKPDGAPPVPTRKAVVSTT